MMEAVRTSEMSVDNHFTRQYNPEDSSEQLNHIVYMTLHKVKIVSVFSASKVSQTAVIN
jgi:hypothetical protein